MKKILLSLFMSSMFFCSYAQDDAQGCRDYTLPFLPPFEGYYLGDYCKFSESFSYDFVVDRNSRSIHKEGVYRETWYKRKADNNKHISGPQILKQQSDAIKAAGGEVVPESDGSVFKLNNQGKEFWVYINANTYSADLDNYGVISIETGAIKQESGSLGTSGSVVTTGSNDIGSPQNQQVPVKIEGSVNPVGSIGLPDVHFNEDVAGTIIPATINDFKFLTEDITFNKVSTVSIPEVTKNAINSKSLIGNAPQVVLLEISEFKGTSAIAKGRILPNGTEIVTSGYCWSTGPNPTITNYHESQDGLMTDLSPGTVYYVRNFATTNSGTTYYGNELSFNSGQIIGSFYVGGLVFYNDGMGHGFVTSETDQRTNEPWGCMGGSVSGVSGISVDRHSGYTNTNTIAVTCHQTHCAARVCFDLTLHNYYNWILPSIDEMYLMYRNLYLQNLGGFDSDDFWWTSSEFNRNEAYAFSFGRTDHTSSGNKDLGAHVRAIRSF